MKSINVTWQWTVPNVLSLVRIALIPVFALLYLNSNAHPALLWWAFAVVVVSGLTDLFDGWIARRFNQISEAGKLLDPLADKLTQLTVVICLATQFHELVWLMALCLLKEAAQVIGGLLLLRRGDEVRGSQWFGKICTFVFYSAMAAIVLFDDMPSAVRIGLVVLVGVLMLITFFGYLSTYIGARKALPDKE
ncbi:MAG: CDP-alcohol phosphatidyltransferase family protein [Ruminococcaceae bacterium]|nr:CDP-alcohol phosphatidyltransferase family protein [Oscillospiraceae bacterium]